MKAIKLISVLAASLLLSACGEKGISASKPKFAKQGKEVEFAAFKEAVSDENLLGFFSSDDITKVESFSGKVTATDESIYKATLGKKSILEEKEVSVTSLEVQDDIEHRVIKYTEADKGSAIRKSAGYEREDSEDVKYTAYYQLNDFEDKTYFVTASETEKMFGRMDDVSSLNDEEIDEIFQSFAPSMTNAFIGSDWLNYVSPLLEYWDTVSEEEKEKIKFFQNDKVFTVTYANTTHEEGHNSSDELMYTIDRVEEYKIQLDVSKGASFKSKSMRTIKSTIKIEKDETNYNGSTFDAGTVIEEERNNYFDSAIQVKKLNLKPLDISKYKESAL